MIPIDDPIPAVYHAPVMPHFCRQCGTMRANERFSGRGHAQHLCRDCQRLPKQEILDAGNLDDIRCFLLQTHISPKNMKRLDELSSSTNPEVAKAAGLVRRVGQRYPYKRRRWKKMVHADRALLDELASAELLPGYFDWIPSSEYHQQDDLYVAGNDHDAELSHLAHETSRDDAPDPAPSTFGPEDDIPF